MQTGAVLAGSMDVQTVGGIGVAVAYAIFFECSVRLSVPNEFRGRSTGLYGGGYRKPTPPAWERL